MDFASLARFFLSRLTALAAGPRSSLLGCLLVGAAGLTGCATVEGEAALPARNQILYSQKAGSFAPWQGKKVGAISFEEHISSGTVWVLPATARGVLKSRRVRSGGTAVAVTDDGYCLTAAHNIGKVPLLLIRPEKNGWIIGDPSRVVWSGKSLANGPDLALLKSGLPVGKSYPLKMPRPEEIRLGQPLIAAGWGSLKADNSGPSVSAGRVTHKPATHEGASGARWTVLCNNVPLARGDSGAPVFNAQGELLGIHTGGEYDKVVKAFGREHLRGWVSKAECPDPAWIATLIAKDRARHAR